MPRIWCSLSLATLMGLATAPALAAQARVIAEPDYLVSRDDERPHVEMMAAANPRNPRNLIAGSVTFTGANSSAASKAYVSEDGGKTWADIVFPEHAAGGGADPQVAFTSVGTAIFAALTFLDNKAILHAFRSEDGGRTWSKAANLGGSYDHPQLVADHTTGRFANRLYMSVLYGRNYELGVFRSEDDGRTWLGPAKFIEGGKRGLNVYPMVVFSDGALLVPFVDFPTSEDSVKTWRESRIFTVISNDGGVTFSEPRTGPVHLTGDQIRGFYKDVDASLGSSPMFAVDPSARHRDRVYAVWTDYRLGLRRPRAVITWSDDRGATWREPKILDGAAPTNTRQFQAMVAVNKEGTVAVTWYDTRGTTGALEFNQYFAASVDGGETFTAPLRLSSAVSRPLEAGNLLPALSGWKGTEGEMRASLLFAASRWRDGGDYLGFTTDADGTFHPVWADARTGTYQVYTSAVRVTTDTAKVAARPTLKSQPVDVTESIELVRDAGRYDPATREVELWVRIKNKGTRPIYGPIRLEFRRFASGMAEQGWQGAEYAPEILSATNKKTGVGAVLEYDAALGTEGVLPPGGVSGAMLWRLRLKDVRLTPDMHVYVTGSVP